MCYSLLAYMLPEQQALDFGFSQKLDERIYLSYTNQIPRPENQTVMYFTIKDEPYKQAVSDPHHYTDDNVEVLEQMRQIRLTVDIYSKAIPMGVANDVARWLNSALVSDQFEEWRRTKNWPAVIERIDLMPDLSYLVEGQTWNSRAQLVVYLNYRDSVALSKVYMTRQPTDISDLPISINHSETFKD